MIYKKSTRAGLVALVFGALLGVAVNFASVSVSHAQAPAAAPAADAAKPRAVIVSAPIETAIKLVDGYCLARFAGSDRKWRCLQSAR